MSSLSQRLHLGVQQKQILTPGLVQMVTVLQLNRLELKDMIMNEIAENPVLEEAADAGEELTPAEVQSLLERERTAPIPPMPHSGERRDSARQAPTSESAAEGAAPETSADGADRGAEEPVKTETDPFDEIDFGSFFDDYLDPGFKSPASELSKSPPLKRFFPRRSR